MSPQDKITVSEITHTLGIVDGIGSTIHRQNRANEPFLEETHQGARGEAVKRMPNQ